MVYDEGSGGDDTTVFVIETRLVEETMTQTENNQVTLSEEELTSLRGLEQKFVESEAERAALKAQVEALGETNARLVSDNRLKKFTDVVRGRDGENDGAPWPGEIEKNVEDLVALAEAVGEDSDVFKNHVVRMAEIAKTFASSQAFTSIGSSVEDQAAKSGQGEVDKLAEAKRAADPSLSYDAAVGQVFRERPDLYDRSRREGVFRGREIQD